MCNSLRVIFLSLCLLLIPQMLLAAEIESTISEIENRNGRYYILMEKDNKWYPLAPNLEIQYCEGEKAGLKELIRMSSFDDKPALFRTGNDNIIYSIFFVCL